MSLISKQVDEFSPEEKRILLAELLQEKIDQSKSLFPLSQGQQALWFLYKLAPQSWVYNILWTVRICSEVDTLALQRAFQALIKRHPSLRTSYIERDGKPIQQIHEDMKLNFEEIDASSWSSDELNERVTEAGRRPFNLEQGSVLRVSLFTRSPQDHIFMLAIHHIACDLWSQLLLIDEFRVLYPAQKFGTPVSMTPQNLSYVEYVSSQNKMLADPAVEQLWSYWQKQLAGELSVLNLPTDRPRPPVQTYQGASITFKLTSSLAQELKKLALEEKATLYMVLLAAFQVLLYRYTGQEDILVGSPTFGRNQAEFANVVGYFVNPVTLRANFADRPTFKAFLAQVRHTVLGAIAHQDYPFTLLVERLQPNRDSSRSPLFQAVFVLQKLQQFSEIVHLFTSDESAVQVDWGGLKLEPFEMAQQEGQFDLALEMVEAKESLFGVFKYNTDLFDASTIQRIATHFQILLEGIVTNPDEQVTKLPLLTEVERQQLLMEWNTPSLTLPPSIACIHELFEAQVEQTPDAVAVIETIPATSLHLTYRELNNRANQLAHYLQSLGIKPDSLVGLCVERSLEMMVGLLGILKAGGGYLMLDPVYPSERLGFILQDAQVPLLLTQKRLLERLPLHNAKVICLDIELDNFRQESQENPVSKVTINNLAYVIYTSGSTGKPKGVLINHINIVRLFTATQPWYKFNQQDVWTLFHSIAFDFSVWEMWGALIYGGRLVIVPYFVSREPEAFYQLLCNEQVTVLNQTPSAFLLLMKAKESLGTINSINLRLVIFGGEALELQSLKPWFEQHGDQLPQLVNMYGITETTVHVTYRPLTIDDLKGSASIVGCPIQDLQVYLLDQDLQPVPIGVRGEMYVGGAGLARGYLNRPDLTAERFISNPFDCNGGGRLYKTGDLARYLPNGDIEYLGRIDRQVKIRGFRIEVAEIEAVLGQHSLVHQNVVTVREDVPGDKRLVAYVVLKHHSPTTNIDLHGFLKDQLPNYMVPTSFVMLDALPLTNNGKINQQALPKPQMASFVKHNSYQAPRNPIEETLADIWADVLRVELVGVYDNFFELGGDSILSIQVIAKANQVGLQFTPTQIFQHQTIVELAAVAGETQTIAPQDLVTGELPLTPIQHWFFDQNFPHPSHWNQFVLLEVQPDLTPAIVSQLLHQLLLHHDALRLRFQKSAALWQQSVSLPEQTVPLTVFDLSSLSPSAQESALQAAAGELQSSLNLQTGPIIRVGFFNLGDGQPHRLLIVIHHLAVDGVSWRILLSDLQLGYQQLLDGEELKLPPKTSSFQLWANRLSEYARSGVDSSELDYWRQCCRQPLQPLPTDFVGGANTVKSASRVSVCLSSQQTRALLQEVPKAYKTQINDVLLSALLQVLSQWSGGSSLVLNLEGHGREDIFEDVDTSRTVGWFTSVFPVVLHLPSTDHLGEVLTNVKQQLRAIPHKGIGYGILRYLHPDTQIASSLDCQDLTQVSFNYLGQFDQVLPANSVFHLASVSSGLNRHPLSHRTHLLEIDALIIDDKLQVDWNYSHHVHRTSTIESLAIEFIQALEQLIAHCLSDQVGGFSPDDFPLAQLSFQELEQSLQSFQEQGEQRISQNICKNIEDIYPLSPMQQGILFHTLYTPESGVYFVQLSCSLSGNFQISAFQQAWMQVIAQYPILRTAFIWSGLKQPLQVVFRQVGLPLEIKDWRGLSPETQQEQLSAFLQSDRQQSFPLSQAPLMRLTLFQLSEDVYQFVWSHHHLVMDGWSLSKVLAEVFTYYQTLIQGKNLELEVPVLYSEYIAWLQKQDKTRAEVFWRQLLKGFTKPISLVIDKSTKNYAEEQVQQRQQQIQLSKEATTNLVSFTRQYQLTLSTLLQGTWALLLGRYTGEIDIVFGVTVSGRSCNLFGVESIVGLLVNTLPMRVLLDGDESLLLWLKQIQTQQVEISQYEYSSLVEIQGWSDVPRSMPLFESQVVFENYPINTSIQGSFENLKIGKFQAAEQTNFPLTLEVVPGSELSIRIISSGNCRFNTSTVTQILKDFQAILDIVISQPNIKINALVEILEEAKQKNKVVKEEEFKEARFNKLKKMKQKSKK